MAAEAAIRTMVATDLILASVVRGEGSGMESSVNESGARTRVECERGWSASQTRVDLRTSECSEDVWWEKERESKERRAW
jgi:hypothetical protein